MAAIHQLPDSISLSGNLKKYILSSGGVVSFVLKDGATTIFEASYEPGSDGRVTIDVKDIVESRLSYLISHNNFYEQPSIAKTFTAIIDGAQSTFRAIRSGVENLSDTTSNWLRGNFLTWQPTSKQVTYYSPEWITYYAQQACTIKLKATFPDNTEQTITLGSCEAGKAFTSNVQYAVVSGLLGQKYPQQYDVYAEASGTRLSYIQRYFYSDIKSHQEQWFLFENSLGGLDTVRASGDTDFTGTHEHKISNVGDTASEYDVDTTRSYNKNTGYLAEYERRWLLDFFPAHAKYIYIAGALRAIAVTESDVSYSASDLPSSYNFKYLFSDLSPYLNLIRNEESIPESITIPNIDSPNFHLPPRLSEYPRVPLHEGVILPAFDPHSEEAKVTTLGAILQAAVFEVFQKISSGEGGGELVNILRSTSSEEASDYSVFSSLRTILEIKKYTEEHTSDKYLSKLVDDTAQGLITFLEGVEVGAFTPGALGSGAAVKMVDGTSYAEVDNLTVRQKATFRELIIESLKHIGGQLVLTPARMKCVRVVDGGSFYKCYFDTGDGEVSNEFVAGDFARCQVFTGSGTKFYWRLVTLVGEDWINLSKTSAAVGSDAPESGDDITQLGNATDTTRQSAIILSTVGIDAPSWKQYSGISSFSLEGKDTTVFSKLGNKITGETVFTSGGANLDDYLDGVAQDILDALKAAQDAEDKAQQAIEDAEASVATINTEVGKLQDQLDGKVSNWFYAYTPTLSNYPASDWDTTLLKDSHIGDTFTNTEPAPAENAGKSWRFVKNGSTYSWAVIADSDAVKALLEASKAQATADGKSTTHLFQPTKYNLGDMWVLNADQTVNGTLYKQGELLTATQDSETFVQAHWLKRIRYTDDTAINDLEIGSRNFWLNSEKAENIHTALSFSSRNLTGLIEDGAEMTIQFNIDATVGYDFRIYKNNTNTVTWGTSSPALVFSKVLAAGKQTVKATFAFDASRPFIILYKNDPVYRRADVTNLMLGLGNKVTWTEAPEDTQAKITKSKQEAEAAAKTYADIKTEAERLLAEAYADGIVTAEEQARIDDVNTKLAAAKAHAEQLVSNLPIGGRNLFNKSKLVVGYPQGASVIPSISINNDYGFQITGTAGTTNTRIRIPSVISETGWWTVSCEVQGNFGNLPFSINIAGMPKKSFTTGLATEWKRAEITSNVSGVENYVEFADIGYIVFKVRRLKIERGNKATDWTLAPEDEVISNQNLWLGTGSPITRSGGNYSLVSRDLRGLISEGDTCTLQFDLTTTLAYDSRIYASLTPNIDWGNMTEIHKQNVPSGKSKYKVTFNYKNIANRPYLLFYKNVLTTDTATFENLTLVKGTKAVWSEAPEDVQARIDAEKTRINDILSDNVADPSEKQYLSNLWQEIYAEYPRIWAQANDYSVSKTTYEHKYTALKNILDPVLANLTINSTVSGASIRTAFSQYYDARTVLQNAITNKVNQNAIDADAKAQALEYLKLAIGQDAKVQGALFTLVTILLKEDMNADVTAGVSGLQGVAKNLPAFWAGGTDVQAQQGTAKAIIRHDGSSKFEETQVSGSVIAKQGSSGMQTWLDSSGIRVFNDTGQMNIRFGMKNGYAILEYYDNDGKFLYDLGPNGIMKMEVREEKWTVFKRISLGTDMSTILNEAYRYKYKKSWNQLEVTYYAYTSKISAGINQDPTNDGAVFTSMSKTGARMPIGFYCRKMPLNMNMIYKDPFGGNPSQVINSQLPYIQSGNENVYDKNNICFMDLEYYTNGKRSTSLYHAYWNETP